MEFHGHHCENPRWWPKSRQKPCQYQFSQFVVLKIQEYVFYKNSFLVKKKVKMPTELGKTEPHTKLDKKKLDKIQRWQQFEKKQSCNLLFKSSSVLFSPQYQKNTFLVIKTRLIEEYDQKRSFLSIFGRHFEKSKMADYFSVSEGI